jgi:hypothetical protein
MSLTARTLASCLLFSLFVGPLGAQHLLVDCNSGKVSE